MAKIKFGMFMTDARGKVGGQVFSKNRSGAYVRTKVTPSNARTPRQAFIRAALSRISANWSALTDEQRKGFDKAVENWKTTNVFGDATAPTGKTLFTKLNMNLANSEQAEIDTAPEKLQNPQVVLVEATIDTGVLIMKLEGSSADTKIVVSATALLSRGTKFSKGKYRQIGVIDGSVATSYDLTSMYTAKFGTPSDTGNTFIQVSFVLPNGQTSIPQSLLCTFL